MKFNELSNKIPVSRLLTALMQTRAAAGFRLLKRTYRIFRSGSRERVLETDIWLVQENYFWFLFSQVFSQGT